jgi:hypothetical protein
MAMDYEYDPGLCPWCEAPPNDLHDWDCPSSPSNAANDQDQE